MLKVREREDAGIHTKNFCLDIFKKQEKVGFTDDWASYVSGTLLEAGFDTTASIFLTFAVAMINFPEVQKRAQAEVDAICGNRLPTMADEPNMQYIISVLSSKRLFGIFRLAFSALCPMLLPMQTLTTGYHFPAKTGMMINVWAFNNNPERYPNPRVFDPMRHINDYTRAQVSATLIDPWKRNHFTFGVGRRVCPGLNIVEQSLFLGIAYMLWAFTITSELDANGGLIPVSTEVVT
ncbi:putative cytochrome p450 [Phaeomoniella chlamydospora]|uniref:Putative cytochrome p450 n=1 Tax=Phaeomoniella chlamydospora TaxID=158046 RepID=A0A0G2F1T6_PHACM|nr:putative cytochrome p450 [Phaeomoniella chlamydospora]